MLNKDLFFRDPTNPDNQIPNLGVAKIGRPASEGEWATLKFELEHFVCEGQYEAGLDRILSGYTAHMDQPQQPAVWVSGFYGSGKSHFLKVLQNLWLDTKLEHAHGASARGITDVSERVALQLRELDALGKRSGGLWAAAGTLGAGASGSVRLSFLGILFASAGLPTEYAAAKLIVWLKQEGANEKVRAHLEANGRTLERELRNMYVSTALAEALLEAMPQFAGSPAQALERLDTQYPPKLEDIDNEELCDTIRDVLLIAAEEQGKPGKLPCTLIVMDELEQYIGDDVDRADKVLRVVEAVVAKFGSQILFAASGQSAMGAAPKLLRLQDRFSGRIEFTDTDVDRVVRRVILRKAPDKAAMLEEHLTQVSGEVNRHLQDTKLKITDEDRQAMVADYPLLPTRRRFWESVSRAIDRVGSAAQLRTQLRAVQDAARYVGDKPVGFVVPGDFIYGQQVNGMLHSGVLSKDMHDTIEALKDTSSMDGGLKFRIATLVFLISQLKEVVRNLGVRANPATIADLLVVDLNEGSAKLRTDVEAALKTLADDGVLQAVDGEYSLQGKIGAEWQQDYIQRYNRIKDEAARIAATRSQQLQKALERRIGNLAFNQGDARVPRKGQYVYGMDAPDLSTGFIPVWVRDEWSGGSLKAAESEAASRGSEDPVVHLLIPKRDAQAIKEEIVKFEAAQETLELKVSPTTEEGAAARAGIQGRRDTAEENLRRLMTDLVGDARVLLSGGNEINEGDVPANVAVGLRSAAQRMYPKFDVGEGNWGLVVQHASKGDGTALEALGYQGEPKAQKVCAEILQFIGASGKKGSEIRERFTAKPYGWSRDAVDGSLMVLARSGDLKVQLNGADAMASQVTQDRLGTFTFAAEQQPFTVSQRMELRSMLSSAGAAVKSGEEAESLASFLTQLLDVGQRAGGAAPLPAVPDLQPVRDIAAMSGNQKLTAAWQQRDELLERWNAWRREADEATRRMAEWQKLGVLTSKGAAVPEAADVREQMQAIESSRSLLAEPDPARPLISKMVDALRSAIQRNHESYKTARAEGIAELEAAYGDVPADKWQAIVRSCGLGPLPDLDLGTDEDVLKELDDRPLGMWQDLIRGMRGRIEDARQQLAKASEPDIEITPYTPPARQLNTAEDVDAYVTEMRSALMHVIESGGHVIIRR